MGDGLGARHIHTLHPAGGNTAQQDLVTQNVSGRKVGVETVVAAFTEHLAVVLLIALDVPSYVRSRLLEDEHNPPQETFPRNLRQQWARWAQQRKHYP